jgi:hypothetical protein
MNAKNEGTPSVNSDARLPLWLVVTGVIISTGSGVLAARLIWEQTVWTWERGPQMVGFSLVHGPGIFLILFPFLLVLWTVPVVVRTVRSLARRNRITQARWICLALVFVLFVLLSLPDVFWQRVFISRMAASHHAGDLIVYAAYGGHSGTVKAYISHGVPVDITDRGDRRTALHAAALAGNVQTISFLVSRGANIDALDRSGDSPLELAAGRGQKAAAEFLAAHGAKRIHGDEEQHRQAIEDRVRDDINEMMRNQPELKEPLPEQHNQKQPPSLP